MLTITAVLMIIAVLATCVIHSSVSTQPVVEVAKAIIYASTVLLFFMLLVDFQISVMDSAVVFSVALILGYFRPWRVIEV